MFILLHEKEEEKSLQIFLVFISKAKFFIVEFIIMHFDLHEVEVKLHRFPLIMLLILKLTKKKNVEKNDLVFVQIFLKNRKNKSIQFNIQFNHSKCII